MRIGLKFYCICALIGFSLSLKAQEPLAADSSTLSKQPIKPVRTEKKETKKTEVTKDSTVFFMPSFKPDSKRAVIYSAILPGLGQFYNKKYWKIPIVLGGAFGLTYAISWNGSRYNEYKEAYSDFVTDPAIRTSWHNFIPSNDEPQDYLDNSSKKEYLQSSLRRKKDFFRRNRDLAIIASVGVYALCIIDAYVDAQLYDFDISPDLSMRVEPAIWMPTPFANASIGLQCRLYF